MGESKSISISFSVLYSSPVFYNFSYISFFRFEKKLPSGKFVIW